MTCRYPDCRCEFPCADAPEEIERPTECQRNSHRDTGRGICAECGEVCK